MTTAIYSFSLRKKAGMRRSNFRERVLMFAAAFALLLFAVPIQAGAAPTATFAATFVQTRTLPGFDTPIVSHGLMRVNPHGFYWEIKSPYHYLFAMHDGQVREELPDGTKRQLDPDQKPWLAAVEHIFVSTLSGDRSQLQRYFNVEAEPLKTGTRVTLTPKPGALAKVIGRIEVIESAPGRPERLQIREKSGARMDIRFTPVTDKP
ncbi:MAG TPA: outer membrane lipoprotein carrier protein LolA [Gammaproteobacteria bacterium]|nr:outer membrane lipoprotein carrier protein LolA [Gammaproteobacteria bacterium]